jgi:hypothetical protein
VRRAIITASLVAIAIPAAAQGQTGGIPPTQPSPPPAQPPPAQPPPAQPAPPPESPDRITIATVFKTITLGEPTWISGRFRRLESPDAEAEGYRGRTITLEEAPYPFTAFTAIATAATDREGYWSFRVAPRLNSRYRAVASDPPATSDAKLVRVRIDVGVRVNRTRVASGASVEFSGTALPAHDGSAALIQRRDPDGGRFETVGRTRLRDDGEQRSRYRRRVRVARSGVYRVRVNGDADHLPGNSRAVEIAVRR